MLVGLHILQPLFFIEGDRCDIQALMALILLYLVAASYEMFLGGYSLRFHIFEE